MKECNRFGVNGDICRLKPHCVGENKLEVNAYFGFIPKEEELKLELEYCPFKDYCVERLRLLTLYKEPKYKQ